MASHARVSTQVTGTTLEVLEAWATFVISVNDGAATLVAGHGASKLQADGPIASLKVVFLTVAHTPYFTEAQIKNRLLVDHHRSLACCQLQTKRHAAVRMSAEGFGCLRSGSPPRLLPTVARSHRLPPPPQAPPSSKPPGRG